MRLHLDTSSVESYRLFLRAKSLPRYRVVGHTIEVPDEYMHLLGLEQEAPRVVDYRPMPFLFDYQAAIAGLAIGKEYLTQWKAGASVIAT